jgi:hypothetical protein
MKIAILVRLVRGFERLLSDRRADHVDRSSCGYRALDADHEPVADVDATIVAAASSSSW